MVDFRLITKDDIGHWWSYCLDMKSTALEFSGMELTKKDVESHVLRWITDTQSPTYSVYDDLNCLWGYVRIHDCNSKQPQAVLRKFEMYGSKLDALDIFTELKSQCSTFGVGSTPMFCSINNLEPKDWI